MGEQLRTARRSFLGRASKGMGAIALGSLLDPLDGRADAKSKVGIPAGMDGLPHVAPKVKRVIFLCMAGGPSHLESFDYKPKLAEMHGKPMPSSITQNQPIAQLQGQKLVCQAPLLKFKKWGKSGQEISEVFPQIGSVADEICIIRSLHTDQINHDPAHTVMNTGTSISGRPSMGSWITYGLGSEASNLPGFVVLTSKGGRNPQPIAIRQWGSGFLPSRYQGVKFRSIGDPVLNLSNPPGLDAAARRQMLDELGELNQLK
ncbi:MAG: DUF1501 domain-containing protein, partial [Planctomycetes bacterium]|nr:DUF1501 domain-containing protein [Planctomycetota bacterium]